MPLEAGASSTTLGPVLRVFREVGATIVPESSRLGADEWSEIERIAEEAVARRPAALRRRLRLFLRLLEWGALFRFGRPFSGLDTQRRARFLRAIQESRLLLLRRGFWGLRTLVLMGYYGRPSAIAEIGYGGDPRGWEARR